MLYITFITYNNITTIVRVGVSSAEQYSVYNYNTNTCRYTILYSGKLLRLKIFKVTSLTDRFHKINFQGLLDNHYIAKHVATMYV